MVYNDLETPVPGLDQIPVDERPPVWIPFQMFHLMVGLGTAMLALAALAVFLRYKGSLERHRWVLWLLVFSPVAAMVANQAGWITAEVGRQPWIVYPSIQEGVEMMGLRTSDGLSESVVASQVVSSIVMFGIIYSLLFAIWIFVLNAKIKHGPDSVQEMERLKDEHRDESMRETISHSGRSYGGSMMEDAGE